MASDIKKLKYMYLFEREAWNTMCLLKFHKYTSLFSASFFDNPQG